MIKKTNMLVFNNIKYISAIALCVVIFISVVLTGCIPVPDRVEDSSSGKDSIIFFSDSATENLLRALSRNDYRSFSKDFDKELLSITTVDKFNSVSNSFKSDLGDYVHHSIFLKPRDISAFKVNNNEVKITDFRYFSLDLNTCILCLRHVYHHINKYNLTASSFSVQKKYGGDLLSHTVTSEVPSALKGLTSVFGMETGVSPSL